MDDRRDLYATMAETPTHESIPNEKPATNPIVE
jgi:hypothetical protein